MIRLLGVLVGSALAVAALVVFVGIPQFTTETSVSEPSVITLPMRPEPLTTADGHTDVVEPEAQPSDGPVETAAAGRPAESAAAPPGGPDESPPDDAAQALSPAPLPETAPLSWHAFWSPFRSEIAANGFVDRLQSVTGLDYRVVKVETGVYEVAFAYADDDEITPKLSQISAATGLDLAAN